MKPGIVTAVALSAFAGMVLALRGVPELKTGGICLASVVLAAAGSAVVNNVLDRRIDELMDRVCRRSSALAAVGTGPAMGVALSLITAGVGLAAIFLGSATALLLLAAVFSYTLYYTLFLKRRYQWGAVVGGLPGALPVLIGQAATGVPLDRAVFTLFLVMLLWQPPHFWTLSLLHQDDYRRAGIPVLPVVRGERFTKVSIMASALLLVALTFLLYVNGPCSRTFAGVCLAAGAGFLVTTRTFLRSGRYRLAFTGSILYLLVLLLAVVTDLCVR